MEEPLVSVIVPAFNVVDCLTQCLESILKQSYQNLEVILVDDGSTDGTGKVCESYAAKHSHLHILSGDNCGANFARRDGFYKSKGSYVMFVDADDVIHPDCIKDNLRAMQTSGADISVFKTRRFLSTNMSDNEINQTRITGPDLDFVVYGDRQNILGAFLMGVSPYKNMPLMCMWGKLYSRHVIDAVNWDTANYAHSEDLFVSAQTFATSKSVCYLNQYYYYYRQNRPGKLTVSAQHNTSPTGKHISNFDHIKPFVDLVKDIALQYSIDLEHEVIIMQCRQYTYWAKKEASGNRLSSRQWHTHIEGLFLPLARQALTAKFRQYAYGSLCGKANFDSFSQQLREIKSCRSLADFLDKQKVYNARDKIWATCAKRKNSRYAGAWVLMDRPDSTTDNGYYFYQWLSTHHPEIKAYFVISDQSSDWPMLQAEGFNLISAGSPDHAELLNNCDVEIYSYYTFNICEYRTSFDSLKVYLGHGIKKDESLNPGLGPNDLHITTFEREFNWVKKSAKYKPVLTGMPRLGGLLGTTDYKEVIVIAPTWRRWLSKDPGQSDEYFVRWRTLLCSTELQKLNDGFEIIFLVHHEMKSAIKHFDIPKFVKVREYANYSRGRFALLAKNTDLLVTDYSSVAFDFAIAGAAVLYYQFDHDKFYSLHTVKKAWFDYEADGLGPVAHDAEALLDHLGSQRYKSDTLVKKYRKRLSALVGNSQTLLDEPSGRVYKSIVEALALRHG